MSFTPMNAASAGFTAVKPAAQNGSVAHQQKAPAHAPSDQDRAEALNAVAHAFAFDQRLDREVQQFTNSPDATTAALKLFARLGTYMQQREGVFTEQKRRVQELEQRLASFNSAPQAAPTPSQQSAAAPPGPAKSTSIRVAPAAPQQTQAGGDADYSGARFEGVSFSIPQRKKLTLEVGSSRAGGVRGVNAQGGPEFALPYSQIEHVFRLQIPDKMLAMDHFLALPLPSAAGADQILWTANDYLPRGAEEGTATQSTTHLATLRAAGCVDIVAADPEQFTAAMPNSRKEPCYHTRAFKGSKEGYLFFLRTGVLFAFKKPVLHFALRSIRSLACTTVTKHTFSLVVEAPDPTEPVTNGGEGEAKTWEFSLIDQVDFPGIREYVERHDLHESSLDQRRAKEVMEPAKKRRREEDEPGNLEGGELEKATKAAKGEEQGEDWGADSDEDDDDFAEPEDSDGGSPGESDDDDDDDDDDDGPPGDDQDDDDEMDEDE